MLIYGRKNRGQRRTYFGMVMVVVDEMCNEMAFFRPEQSVRAGDDVAAAQI